MVSHEENLVLDHILMLWRIDFNNFTYVGPILLLFEYQNGVDKSKAIQSLKTKKYCTTISSKLVEIYDCIIKKKMINRIGISPKK